GDAGVPAGAELDVRRQAGVDEALGLADRPFVEPGDPGRERLYVGVPFGVRQGAVHIAIGLGLLATDILRTQEGLQRAIAADEPGQPRHGAATGDHADAN